MNQSAAQNASAAFGHGIPIPRSQVSISKEEAGNNLLSAGCWLLAAATNASRREQEAGSREQGQGSRDSREQGILSSLSLSLAFSFSRARVQSKNHGDDHRHVVPEKVQNYRLTLYAVAIYTLQGQWSIESLTDTDGRAKMMCRMCRMMLISRIIIIIF